MRSSTYYRMAGSLNVHAEYGYLVHEVTAGQVADWWRASRPQSPASLCCLSDQLA